MNMENRVYAKASTIFYHTKKYSENVQPLSNGFFLVKIHKQIDNMSIPNQVMYPKVLKKQAEKNKHISTLIFTTALVTLANKWKESKCP